MSFELSSLGKEFEKNLEGGGRIKNMELYTPLPVFYIWISFVIFKSFLLDSLYYLIALSVTVRLTGMGWARCGSALVVCSVRDTGRKTKLGLPPPPLPPPPTPPSL